LAYVTHAGVLWIVHDLETQILSEGSCVIFSMKNKTVFATKPSPSD
jgi:hypothetical protein